MPKRRANHILVVGSINTDLVVQVRRYPKPGETVLGSGFSTFSGGKGANQAVAAARLGASVRMIGAIGSDSFGKDRRNDLEKEGVDVQLVKVEAHCATGVAVITIRKGQNSIIVAPGANERVTGEYVRHCEAAFQGAAVVLLQLETTLEAVQAAVELAKKHGARVILNPAPAPRYRIPKNLVSLVDDLIPNQIELANMAEKKGSSALVSAINSVHATLGAKRIIVTLGAGGALISDLQYGRKTLPTYDVDPVDTTAAGDAFIGAYAVAVAEGKDSIDAIEWGLAAGAFACGKLGAQPSLPRRDQLEEFLRTAPRRARKR